jgi:hypothetical protein
VSLISRIAIDAPILASRPRLTETIPMWLATVVLLLACIAIAVWNQRNALRNPETSKKQKKSGGLARSVESE